MRRRVRRNGAAGSALRAVGGLVAVPLAAGAVTAISEKVSPTSSASSLAARGALIGAGAAIASFVKRSESPAFAWGGVVGAAATALLWWNYRAQQLDREALAASYEPRQVGAGWHELGPGPISMLEGMAYRAAVDLPFYVPSSVATDERIHGYAADRGFRVTRIYREQPDGSWPADADLYVEAVALRSGELERPSALSWAAFKG